MRCNVVQWNHTHFIDAAAFHYTVHTCIWYISTTIWPYINGRCAVFKCHTEENRRDRHHITTTHPTTVHRRGRHRRDLAAVGCAHLLGRPIVIVRITRTPCSSTNVAAFAVYRICYVLVRRARCAPCVDWWTRCASNRLLYKPHVYNTIKYMI